MFIKVKGIDMSRNFKLTNMIRYLLLFAIPIIFIPNSYGATTNLGLINQLTYVKSLLSQIGPILSAILFILAGIFYALGQLMTPDKKAIFHSTAINLIMGAVIVAILSFTSTALATASTHLLNYTK